MPTAAPVLPVAECSATPITGVGFGRPDPSADAAQAEGTAAATAAADTASRLHGRSVRIDCTPPVGGARSGHVREAAAR
ncbi:hypothetical protein [Streptomyces sp. NRRL F-4428]|uniref:hypothetical protein n=1 Tax=Streptomyces sp. NRRL F-4428 TaxID=1609137 RepID=UPI00069672E4|nr:hypothetical protein [Streptomyces sp. NRRL F-4428]